ncbi:YacL family protein [Vibrio aestuarianus]|nr:YacL family protein [Vibrio aestuarianus]MDE1225765.1 YacL family protein [Vibrio aestuarianus]MDE1292089.1 YacL family protein [Vibrio aestuarianus]MDE1306016.1 YacL family protein [Vibrio aestuarianus]
MGHEIIGRWLQEEINKDHTKIGQVLQLIETAQNEASREVTLEGCEISLIILSDEVTVQENVLSHADELDTDSEFDFYDCESTASCGIDDFVLMMDKWCQFIGYHR